MHHSNTRRFHKHLKSPEGKCLPTAKTGGQEEFVVVDQISGAEGGRLVTSSRQRDGLTKFYDFTRHCMV